MFDYEGFKNAVVLQMKVVFDNWTKENDDIYILSLDCANGMDSIGAAANTQSYLLEQGAPGSDDYWYYKYCEEEWDLLDTFETISAKLDKYLCDNKVVFTNQKSQEYTEEFYKHREKIMDCCIKALISLRQYLNRTYPHILLTFNIREDFDRAERVEIFKQINSSHAQKEYMDHIDDFA